MNFALFPEMKARGAPDGVALLDSRRRLTWGELDEAANRFANWLVARGVTPGERLATYLPNRVELAIAILGALKSGVVAVPLNWRLQGRDLARVIDHCAPSLLITTEEKRAALPGAVGARRILTAGAEPGSGSFWTELATADTRFSAVPCQADDVANLLYTSGTTATPKAAIHTHGMRVAIAAAMADCFKLSSRDVGLAISPMFHTSGLSVLSNALFAGCKLVLVERWDLAEFLDAIERERVTFMHLISTIVVDIARAPAEIFNRDTGSMRFTWSGGHNIDPAMLETFEQRVGGVLLQGYSRTEGGLSYNPLDRARRRFDAHGLPNRNSSELAIFDPVSARLCPPGLTGEIVVRGDGVSPGYWDGDFVRVRPAYDGGWQPTGDIGFFDQEGMLHFLGRNDHLIKTGGENVYPNEVAEALLAMAGVADAVVLGLADERLGQRVAALVVPADPRLTVADIDREARRVLTGFKIPRTIAITDALPRLGNEKVNLSACRHLLQQAAAGDGDGLGAVSPFAGARL